MSWNQFGPFLAVDPRNDTNTVKGGSGQIFDVDDSTHTTPLVVQGLAGNVLAAVTSNANGLIVPFQVEDKLLVNWFSGGVDVQIDSRVGVIAMATEARDTAVQALADLKQYIIDNPGPGGGSGLPAGTTLDAIPNGTTRLALTQAERDKLASTPTTFLQVGTSAGTAKAGDYSPTPAGIGAVQNVTGADRFWGRVKSLGQQQPTAAEGALDDDWLFWDES